MHDRPRALLSVSDKRDLVPFASALAELGFEIVSTGGTFRTLESAGVPATYVTAITGQPEVFNGRVKTLHPIVHGGILFRRDDPAHVSEAAAQGIRPIDIVVVNLYPFEQTVQREGISESEAIEQIDIGGPAMVRAAAKNFQSVTVVVSPSDYDRVLDELRADGATSVETRRALALAAFRHTAHYDAAIARYLGGDDVLPDRIQRSLQKVDDLRYGENPHQRAALYTLDSAPPFGGASFLQGKALSYNNIIDLESAVACVAELDEPAAVAVKHTNPCGVGRSDSDLHEAWSRAYEADPVSVFGGIVAFNRKVDRALAVRLNEIFLEVVAAPEFDDDAMAVFAQKKNLRVMRVPTDLQPPARWQRDTLFGVVAQTPDPLVADAAATWKVVSARQPTEQELAALRFLWRVCKHVKSNAIVIGSEERTFGVGAGQMSRVESVNIAVRKATGDVRGAALASDAFFPFRDGVDAAAAAGVRAIVQPGGSMRDDEVIAACDENDVALVFTGRRHFKH